jgi:CheY-specific phosphatase CheX
VNAELINPFVCAAVEVFSTMLECELTRGALAEALVEGHR